MLIMNNEKIIFYIVATPIGNLEDITYRAVKILSSVDVILCEDTRVTGKLLSRYKIKAKLESYHANSSKEKEDKILRNVDGGVIYALVSDAGTPTISDPGSKLIDELYKRFRNNIDVIVIPGAIALTTALASSGFMGNQFTFYGFLPHKKGRKSIFKEIFSSDRISIFYESPHRIMKTLEFIKNNYKDSKRKIHIARELTKMYEEKIHGSIDDVYLFFKKHQEKIKGEFVVVIDRL